MDIVKVGVVGCGTMGSGICEIVARSGVAVSFVEVSDDRVEAGLERIGRSLQRAGARKAVSMRRQPQTTTRKEDRLALLVVRAGLRAGRRARSRE